MFSGMDNPFLERSDVFNLSKDMRVEGTARAPGTFESVARIALRMSNAENLLKSTLVIIAEPEERPVNRNALSIRVKACVMSLSDAAFKFSSAYNVQVAVIVA